MEAAKSPVKYPGTLPCYFASFLLRGLGCEDNFKSCYGSSYKGAKANRIQRNNTEANAWHAWYNIIIFSHRILHTLNTCEYCFHQMKQTMRQNETYSQEYTEMAIMDALNDI
ncbi:hypothetical protein QZH41_019130 [Actinostola sp. cb2023]|nr:hypothetical protein QZH41_019130 [Actinostola sp. cb2023]